MDIVNTEVVASDPESVDWDKRVREILNDLEVILIPTVNLKLN